MLRVGKLAKYHSYYLPHRDEDNTRIVGRVVAPQGQNPREMSPIEDSHDVS
jgi:hypothetical protein